MQPLHGVSWSSQKRTFGHDMKASTSCCYHPYGDVQTLKSFDAQVVSLSMFVTLRLDTPMEIDYVRHGGIMPYVLNELTKVVPARVA